MNEWVRGGLEDLANSFPSSLTIVWGARSSTSCSATLCKSFLSPSVEKNSRNCGQSLPSSVFSPPQVSARNCASPSPSTNSFQCQLFSPLLSAMPADEGADGPGWVGAVRWIGRGEMAFVICSPTVELWISSEHVHRAAGATIKLSPTDSIPAIQCIDRQSSG